MKQSLLNVATNIFSLTEDEWAFLMNTVIPDVIMAGTGFAIFILYHLVLLVMTWKQPMKTTIGQNHQARSAWCRGIWGSIQHGTMAVQTLRNGMIASQLLATTSFTITSALSVIIVSTDWTGRHFGTPITGISFLSNETVVPPIKLFVLILSFIAAFFCYLLSIRAYYHASFLVTITKDQCPYYVDSDYIARILIRGANFHTLGTRAYYAAFLALMWLFGPIPVVVCSLLLVMILYSLDYVTVPSQQSTFGSQETINSSNAPSLDAPNIPIKKPEMSNGVTLDANGFDRSHLV